MTRLGGWRLSSTLIREYIWMNGVPVGVIEGGQLFYIRTDHIGRPVFATNDLGLKVWEASYLPFGGVHTSTGAINLRFPGQWFQSESGLHQNWMRDYDPTTGRYLQGDPLGLVDGASVYGYALQNPGRFVDPRGEAAQTALLCVGPQAAACAAGAGIALGWYFFGDEIADFCGELVEDLFPPIVYQDNDDRNPSQDKKLTPSEADRLKKGGEDPHAIKKGFGKPAHSDLYKDKRGNIYVKPKGGTGPGEPTGLNINDF